VIDIRGIAKHFGRRSALAPLDLRVAPGEVVALVGPNGAGKSTTLRILAGILAPSAGTATVAGWDVVKDGVAARRHLGYMAQRLGVPSATVVSDLAALVADVRGVPRARALAGLAEAGLADRAGATLAELSGGQRQRVLLALATLGELEALLLDEPSISLDTEGAEEVREAIRASRQRGAAVLFASHHLHDVAVLADRIVVMVEGRVTAVGSLADLAVAAGVRWSGDPDVVDPPIERIYRTLVTRGRETPPLRLVRGHAA